MPEFVRGFVIPQVTDVHEWFQRCLKDAERLLGDARRTPLEPVAQGIVDDLTLAYNTFNRNLREAAEVAAAQAMVGMKARLEQHERPVGPRTPASNYVVARPLNTGNLETGMVGVGEIEELKRIRNPDGYGTFWRALEYGTGQNGVPSQIGRVLLGVFGMSNPSAPDAQYAGGRGPHPVFLSKTKLAGSLAAQSGFGTIGMEMRGKHFIKYGADEAAVKWRENIAAAQDRALKAIEAIKL